MMPSSYYLYTVFYCYFQIAYVKQILVYFMNISLTSNGSLIKRILLLLLLTLILSSAPQRVVVVCIVPVVWVAALLCVVVHCLHCCPLYASRCIVLSLCCLRRGTLLLSASLPIIWVAALSCASLSFVCIVVRCVRRRPSSAGVGVFVSSRCLQRGFDICGCIAVVLATYLGTVLATNLATNLTTNLAADLATNLATATVRPL
jgi:hypothetical protein